MKKSPLFIKYITILALFSFPLISAALTNGDKRSNVDSIVIHSIGGPECKEDKIVFLPASGNAKAWIDYFSHHKVLGIHYIIDKEGKLESGIPENEIANHAKGHNETSIGIELVNWGDGYDPYTLEQVVSLIKLLKEIQQRWHIPSDRVFSHAQVDKQYLSCGTKRIKKKQDPGANLPLKKLLQPDFIPALFFRSRPPVLKKPIKNSLADIDKACSNQIDNRHAFKVVVEDSLSIRAMPSIKSDRLGWLKPNEKVNIAPSSCSEKIEVIANLTGRWVFIITKNSKKGYVFSGFLELIESK